MKRSEINNALRHAIAVLEKNHLRLPAFAYWTLDDWRAHKADNFFLNGVRFSEIIEDEEPFVPLCNEYHLL